MQVFFPQLKSNAAVYYGLLLEITSKYLLVLDCCMLSQRKIDMVLVL